MKPEQAEGRKVMRPCRQVSVHMNVRGAEEGAEPEKYASKPPSTCRKDYSAFDLPKRRSSCCVMEKRNML